MRLLLLVFLLTWITGIAVGVFQLGVPGWLLGVAIVLWFLKLLKEKRLQVAIGLVLVLMVGGFYGQPISKDVASCDVPDRVAGEIVESEIGRDENIYLVQSDCLWRVTANRWPQLRVGDEVMVTGRFQLSQDIPDEFEGYREYLLREGIGATARYVEIERVGDRVRQGEAVRERIQRQINLVFKEPEAGLISAMLLGERGLVSEAVTEQFRQTGVSHVLAISGLHVSLLVGMLLAVLYLLPISPWVRTLLAIVSIWGYVVLIGMPISAQRAALFWTIALLALRLRRLVALPTLIVLAAVVMVSMRPELLREVGFQLSIMAVVGIGVAVLLTRTVHEAVFFEHRVTLPSLVVVSLGAALGTLPLIAYHFGLVSFVSLLANLLVVPLLPVFLATAIVALVVSLIWLPLGMLLAAVVRLVAWWMLLVTEQLVFVPGAFIENVSLPVWLVIIYYVVWFYIASVLLRKQKRNWREVWG